MPRSIWFLLLLIFLATAPYTLGPIFVRFKSSLSAEPVFEEIPDEYARVLFPQNFFGLIHQFEAMGFSLSTSTINKNLHLMTSLLVNRTTKTFGAVSFIRSLAGTSSIAVSYIEFNTDFEDGSLLETANSSTVRVFYDVPGKTQIKFPHLQDPNALYQVHLYLMKQRNVPAVLPEPGKEKEHYVNSVKESLAEQAELGFYVFDEAKRRYRPTWRGAFRGAYRSVWPMKQIHQRRQEKEGRRIAAEASRANS